MIEMGKSYRTRDGREVRVYATDAGGPWPVHGAIRGLSGEWNAMTWRMDGAQVGTASNNTDLVESDPHGILPRHRELLAEVVRELYSSSIRHERLRDQPFYDLGSVEQAALIALAKLDNERGGV